MILIATGSEVQLAVKAAAEIKVTKPFFFVKYLPNLAFSGT